METDLRLASTTKWCFLTADSAVTAPIPPATQIAGWEVPLAGTN